MRFQLRMGDKFLTPCLSSTEDRQQVLDSLHQEEECQSLLAQVARLREGVLKSRTLEVPHDKVKRVPPIPDVKIRLVTPVSRTISTTN